MRKILVTGASGFIGTHLVSNLLASRYDVSAISKTGGNIGDFKIDAVDCTDWDALEKYISGNQFDSVIHLAASIHSKLWGRDDSNISMLKNTQMVANILGILKNRSKNNFNLVYVSSVSVHSGLNNINIFEDLPINPINPYSMGKYFGELICQYYISIGVPIAILRVAAPYGFRMHDTVLKKFIERAIYSQDLGLYGDGSRSQDFVYIKDIVEGIVLACDKRANGVFNISSGKSVSMKELAEMVLKIMPHSKSKIVHAPQDDPEKDYNVSYLYERARRSFGYKPKYSLEMGLKETINEMMKEIGK